MEMFGRSSNNDIGTELPYFSCKVLKMNANELLNAFWKVWTVKHEQWSKRFGFYIALLQTLKFNFRSWSVATSDFKQFQCNFYFFYIQISNGRIRTRYSAVSGSVVYTAYPTTRQKKLGSIKQSETESGQSEEMY